MIFWWFHDMLWFWIDFMMRLWWCWDDVMMILLWVWSWLSRWVRGRGTHRRTADLPSTPCQPPNRVDRQLTVVARFPVNCLSTPKRGWQAVDRKPRHNSQLPVNSAWGLTGSWQVPTPEATQKHSKNICWKLSGPSPPGSADRRKPIGCGLQVWTLSRTERAARAGSVPSSSRMLLILTKVHTMLRPIHMTLWRPYNDPMMTLWWPYDDSIMTL